MASNQFVALNVFVISAEGLKAADKNGLSDAFVVLKLGNQSYSTKVVPKTLAPSFNEEAQFVLSPADGSTKRTTSISAANELAIEVLDEDLYSDKNDFLGKASVDLKPLVGTISAPDASKDWKPVTVKLDTQGQLSLKLALSYLSQTEEQLEFPLITGEKDVDLSKAAREVGETYWPLKGSVYAPSNFNPTANDRKVPNERLMLEHVYNFRGWDARNNLFVLDDQTLLYNAASLSVLHNHKNNGQQYFTGHNDDVTAVAVHPSGNIVATGQINSLKGTKKPKIIIWSVTKGQGGLTPDNQSFVVLEDFHKRSIAALDFDTSGKFLGSVGTDDDNSIAIYDWASRVNKTPGSPAPGGASQTMPGSGQLIASAPGSKSKVVTIKFNPHDATQFVTCGVKHIKFWQIQRTGATAKLSSKNGVFGKAPIQTVLTVEFLPSHPNLTLAGGFDGSILLFDKNNLVSSIPAHQGQVFSLLRCDLGLISGGKDGKVTLWAETKNAANPVSQPTVLYESTQKPAEAVRALSYDRSSHRVFFGTAAGRISSVGSKPGTQVVSITNSHSSELWGLAAHPKKSIVATVDVSGQLSVWNAESRAQVLSRKLGAAVSAAAADSELGQESSPTTILDEEAGGTGGSCCLAFSPSGDHLAIGLIGGAVDVLSANSLERVQLISQKKKGGDTTASSSAQQTLEVGSAPQPSSVLQQSRVSDLKFSPEGDLLATGMSDGVIYLYSVTNNYKLIATLKGHSSNVTHLDWSVDGRVLQSTSSAYEYLIWDVDNGQQITKTSKLRDLKMHTWTSSLGWPVKGIWVSGQDGTDINAVARANGGDLLVTADDHGYLKLFKFPCFDQKNGCRTYGGHSSHVTNAVFTCDDKRVISIGGQDCSIFQWKVVGRSTSSAPSTPAKGTAVEATEAQSVPVPIVAEVKSSELVQALKSLKDDGLVTEEVSNAANTVVAILADLASGAIGSDSAAQLLSQALRATVSK